jgi:hypothetical protein
MTPPTDHCQELPFPPPDSNHTAFGTPDQGTPDEGLIPNCRAFPGGCSLTAFSTPFRLNCYA